MTLGNVQRIEDGKAKSIPLDTLENLCRELKCDAGDLLRYVPPEESDARERSAGGNRTKAAGGTP